MRTLTKQAAAVMTILAAFLLSWNPVYAHRAPPIASTVQVADETMLMLLSAGTDVNSVWHALPQEKQDAVLRSMFPGEFAQGMRPELMAVYNPGAINGIGAFEQMPDAPEWCTGLYTVTNGYNTSGTTPGPYVDGYGASPQGTTLQLSQSETVSNQYSASIGVSAEVVSATVGFSVTYSRQVGYSYSINVPYGQGWRIQSTNNFRGVGFDIWDDDCGDPADTYMGNGIAWEFTHPSYTAWRMY